jgi:hypothetical protein
MDPAISRGTWRNTTEAYRFPYQSVAPSVAGMTPSATPSPYDDLAAPADMQADCRAASARLQQAARQATRPAPSIHYDEQPGERTKREIQYSEAAARLAGALHFALE